MSVGRWLLNRQHESNRHYFTFEICAYFSHWKSNRIRKNHSMRSDLIISRHLVSGINSILTNFAGNLHSLRQQENIRRFIDNRRTSERKGERKAEWNKLTIRIIRTHYIFMREIQTILGLWFRKFISVKNKYHFMGRPQSACWNEVLFSNLIKEAANQSCRMLPRATVFNGPRFVLNIRNILPTILLFGDIRRDSNRKQIVIIILADCVAAIKADSIHWN